MCHKHPEHVFDFCSASSHWSRKPMPLPLHPRNAASLLVWSAVYGSPAALKFEKKWVLWVEVLQKQDLAASKPRFQAIYVQWFHGFLMIFIESHVIDLENLEICPRVTSLVSRHASFSRQFYSWAAQAVALVQSLQWSALCWATSLERRQSLNKSWDVLGLWRLFLLRLTQESPGIQVAICKVHLKSISIYWILMNFGSFWIVLAFASPTTCGYLRFQSCCHRCASVTRIWRSTMASHALPRELETW